jgi:hypothetical protein
MLICGNQQIAGTRMALDAEVTRQIRRLVRGGFMGIDRIVEVVCQELYEPGELDANEVTACLSEELRALHEEALSWPPITDCDRLDAAFAAMSARGIIALQNAGYTQSDGHDDVSNYVEHHPARSELIGYCFYHGQDLERAIDGEGLHLAFGLIDPTEEQSRGPIVGRVVVEEIDRVGLRTEWDGTFDNRIFIPAFDWKQRRGQGAVAEIAPGVREAIAGGGKLCATFEITGDSSRWVQFVGSVVNAAYPLERDPRSIVAKLGDAIVEGFEPGKYVTVQIQMTSPVKIAQWIEAYFRQVLRADGEYSIDLSLDWIS